MARVRRIHHRVNSAADGRANQARTPSRTRVETSREFNTPTVKEAKSFARRRQNSASPDIPVAGCFIANRSPNRSNIKGGIFDRPHRIERDNASIQHRAVLIGDRCRLAQTQKSQRPTAVKIFVLDISRWGLERLCHNNGVNPVTRPFPKKGGTNSDFRPVSVVRSIVSRSIQRLDFHRGG